jgi:hypothetical protein
VPSLLRTNTSNEPVARLQVQIADGHDEFGLGRSRERHSATTQASRKACFGKHRGLSSLLGCSWINTLARVQMVVGKQEKRFLTQRREGAKRISFFFVVFLLGVFAPLREFLCGTAAFGCSSAIPHGRGRPCSMGTE